MKQHTTIFSVLFLFFIPFISLSQVIPPYNITSNNGSATGYFFLCPQSKGFNPSGIESSLMILDSDGEVAYIRNITDTIKAGDFKIQDNGLMSFSGNGKFYLMDSTFNVIDSVSCQDTIITDTHDMQILPNGNYLMLGRTSVVMDLSSFSLFGPIGVPGSFNALVIAGVVQELDVNKNKVFEWHTLTNFAFDDIDVAWLPDPNIVDWTHCNSVEQDVDGNILLSSRHFNEVTKINRQTGNIMWRLGGNANQFNFLNDPVNFKRQHDVRRISNGNLTLYDNGAGPDVSPFHFSSAKEFQLDENAMTATVVWKYTDDSTEYSQSMGNFQRKPGGSSLINYGNTSSQNKVFSLVSETGYKEFEIAFADSLTSYRSFYYETLPWNLNRPVITCDENSGQPILDAGPGFAAYAWSTGETTQTISLTTTGSYTVTVPAGQDGYFISKPFHVYNMAEPCGLSGVEEFSNSDIIAGPNPATDYLFINFSTNKTHTSPVEVYDISGKLMFTGLPPVSNQITIPVHNFESGVYIIRYQQNVLKVVVN